MKNYSNSVLDDKTMQDINNKILINRKRASNAEKFAFASLLISVASLVIVGFYLI